jgi:hypothetical protein
VPCGGCRAAPGRHALRGLSDAAARPLTFATEVEASRHLARIETDVEHGQLVDPRGSSVLLRDDATAWPQERTVQGRPPAPGTVDTS